jgi:DNA excision repair protein ERCC-3
LDFAHHRQLFLTEQGYSYEIVDESELTARIMAPSHTAS